MKLNFCLAILLAAACPQMIRAAHAETTADSTFQAELKSILARGLESKRGIVFHVNGSEVAGVVKRVLSDAVIVSNQQNATVLIRLDRVDAVALD
jgi:hypothetical protein